SGALNESLADIFGLAVDGFADTVVGDEVAWPLRDVLYPESFGHPGKYGRYQVLVGDSGGVHSNSGIMNRALALTALDPDVAAATGEPGHVAIPRLILDSLILIPYSRDTTLEQFAALLTAYCEAGEGHPVVCS